MAAVAQDGIVVQFGGVVETDRRRVAEQILKDVAALWCLYPAPMARAVDTHRSFHG